MYRDRAGQVLKANPPFAVDALDVTAGRSPRMGIAPASRSSGAQAHRRFALVKRPDARPPFDPTWCAPRRRTRRHRLEPRVVAAITVEEEPVRSNRATSRSRAARGCWRRLPSEFGRRAYSALKRGRVSLTSSCPAARRAEHEHIERAHAPHRNLYPRVTRRGREPALDQALALRTESPQEGGPDPGRNTCPRDRG